MFGSAGILRAKCPTQLANRKIDLRVNRGALQIVANDRNYHSHQKGRFRKKAPDEKDVLVMPAGLHYPLPNVKFWHNSRRPRPYGTKKFNFGKFKLSQRLSLIRKLTAQLLRDGQVETTKARATLCSYYLTRTIENCNDGSDKCRERVRWFLGEEEQQLADSVFDKAPARFREYDTYCKIEKLNKIREDQAEMVQLKLIDVDEE